MPLLLVSIRRLFLQIAKVLEAVRDVGDMGDPPWSKASVLLWSLRPRPALHREIICCSLFSFHVLAVPDGKLSCAPSETLCVCLISDPALRAGCLWTWKPMTLWPWPSGDSPGVSGWGKESVCETGTWTKEVQLRRVLRKVLLVTSPGSYHVNKVNTSPDWVAVYNISEWVCIQSPCSTIWKLHPQPLR